MVVKVKVMERPRLSLGEKAYVTGVLSGLIATNRHFFRNWIRRKDTCTLEYPDKKLKYPSRTRGLHRLMHRKDGSVRCVACMLCATNCPAKCITIKAGEHEDPSIEKFPISFDIDLLLCIYCGFCEEACPCDAIRLDTGVHASPAYSRSDMITRKLDMLERGAQSVARQGGRSL